MTSNGIALSRKLPGLLQAGLTSLNISLDTLDEHKFELMTRRRGHTTVLGAIHQASTLLSNETRGLHSLKVNVVVIGNVNDAEVPAFVELTRHLPIAVRFIEYMPFSDNRWTDSKLVPSASLLDRIRASHPSSALQPIKPKLSDTTREYRIDGFKGTFGFISSMTDHFCAGCSRLRITATGGMKVSCCASTAKVFS